MSVVGLSTKAMASEATTLGQINGQAARTIKSPAESQRALRNQMREGVNLINQYRQNLRKMERDAEKVKDFEIKMSFSEINEFAENNKRAIQEIKEIFPFLTSDKSSVKIVEWLVSINNNLYSEKNEAVSHEISQKESEVRKKIKNDTSSELIDFCLLYTSPSPRDQRGARMPSSA